MKRDGAENILLEYLFVKYLDIYALINYGAHQLHFRCKKMQQLSLIISLPTEPVLSSLLLNEYVELADTPKIFC